MRIGFVDLDTSHPGAWLPIVRELGHEVVGVLDSGDVNPAGYADQFARDQNIPKVYASLPEMAAEVDCAILFACDWDRHVDRARPFVEAGKTVLVDKPIAGRGSHLEQFRAWTAAGARITGGSSLRFCYEVRDWLAQPTEQRGAPHTVFCGCGGHEFSYGIHAISLLCAVMGPGISSVQHLSDGPQHRIRVNWPDARMGLLVIGESERQPFHAAIATDKDAFHIRVDSSKLYRAQLDACLPYLAGAADAPVPFDALIEADLCALAARMSWLNHDRVVALDEVRDSSDGFDGAAFAREYRAQKYPNSRTQGGTHS